MTVYPNPIITVLPPNSEESGPTLSSPNATYPAIPTGIALLSPLMLSDSDSSCGILALDASAPNFFSQGSDLLWSCQSDQTQDVNAVTWRFEKFTANEQVNMADFISQPPFLRGSEYGDGKWGAYQVSSAEGIQIWEDRTQLIKIIGDDIVIEYSGKPAWRDGTQNQPLWHIPFAFYNNTDSDSTTLLPRHISTVTAAASSPASTSVTTSDYTYKFGVLVNKTVIVKQSTIEANIASGSGTILTGNGTILIPGEIVWKCVWEKTLLEVELFVNDPSEGYSRESLRGSINKPDSDKPHVSHNGSSPTGPLPVSQPMGTGDASTTFLDSQQTPDTGPSGNLSTTYKRNSHRKRTSIISGRGQLDPYPHRISIQESRPTTKRIRQLLGMDLTDPDPDGHADLGAVKCTQFIATADGGITPFMDKVSGEGYVVLKEQGGPGTRRRNMHRHRRGTPGMVERAAYSDGYGGPVTARKELSERDTDCFCRWNS